MILSYTWVRLIRANLGYIYLSICKKSMTRIVALFNEFDAVCFRHQISTYHMLYFHSIQTFNSKILFLHTFVSKAIYYRLISSDTCIIHCINQYRIYIRNQVGHCDLINLMVNVSYKSTVSNLTVVQVFDVHLHSVYSNA